MSRLSNPSGSPKGDGQVHPVTMETQQVYYRGFRDGRGGAQVRKVSGSQECELAWRWDLANHSPDGGEWGYGGSGPAQLALALLADAFGGSRAGDQLALAFYQDFKWRVVAGLPQEARWKMAASTVLEEVSRIIGDELGYAASRIQRCRDRLAMFDLNARIDEAEQRGEDLGDFDLLEKQCACQVNEEFRQVLTDRLGMSRAFCSRLFGVAASDLHEASEPNAGGT